MCTTPPPVFDPHPTLHDLPRHMVAKRLKEVRAVRERIVSAVTATGVAMYAICTTCRATVHGWRVHLRDLGPTSESGDVILEYTNACSVCCGSVVELHAEDEPTPQGR
jgi:hypothetical protein